MVKKIYVKKICELEVNEETSDGNFILVLITTKKSRYLRKNSRISEVECYPPQEKKSL